MTTIAQLKEYDTAFAAGKPLVSDAVYDRIYKKKKAANPNHSYFKKAGAKLIDPTDNKRKEVKLPNLMGSLHKKRPKQIVDWLPKLPKNAEFIMTPKYDGVAIELEYIDGKLYKAYSRGEDGVTGFDVTKNIKYVQGALFKLTRRAKYSSIEGKVFVRAECVCHTSIFQKYFAKKYGGKYSTPRSFVAGQVNRLKILPENIKALKKMTLVCYGIHREVNGKKIYHEHKMNEINQLGYLGFTTVTMPTRWPEALWKQYRISRELQEKDYPPQTFADLPITQFYLPKAKDITTDYLNEVLKLWRDSKLIDIRQDGIVLEVAQHQLRKKMGFNDARPGFAFAIKPEAVDQETKVGIIDYIDWQLTSRKLLKPTVVLKYKLDFNGIMVERISAHNAAFVLLHKLKKGTKVNIIHSGDVIPRLIGRYK